MRTIDNGRKIVCFDDHVRRLASSAESMLNQHQIERDSLSLRLLADIRSGITMMDNTSEDLTISILILTQGPRKARRHSAIR